MTEANINHPQRLKSGEIRCPISVRLRGAHVAAGAIDRLRHEMTSYKTRHSSYGDTVGCMPGTRVKILADLEAWASNDGDSKVYWLVGMAGTGKSTISQSFCEILDAKNMLGASFFCSRASDKTSNARLIIPTIAHELASTSPSVKSEVLKAIENDTRLPELTYITLEEQFKKLIHQPIRVSVGRDVKTYKVIIIDAVDECTDLKVVSSLIKLILRSASDIPLKICIASRDETPIRKAFHSRPDLRKAFYLHEVEKDVVKDDIRRYLEKSLSDIKVDDLADNSDEWPSQAELSTLLDRSGALFIYAATVIRYIDDGEGNHKSRLRFMVNQDSKSHSELQTSAIDDLYGQILKHACARREEWEVNAMRQLVSIIVFLRNPLPIQAITSLSEIDAHRYLAPLTSVIHVPTHEEVAVASFHASFPDFVTDPARCSPKRCMSFAALVASEGHEMLALKCLERMNDSLRYNICGIPEELTVSRRGTTNSPDNISKIPAALKYSCIYWASHLADLQVSGTKLVTALYTFLHEHLLHWIECLSALGELEIGVKSLGSVAAALSVNIRCDDLHLLVHDARRCLQMNFEAVQQHCMEIYQSALVWIPKKSLIREVYAANVSQAPKVSRGLSNLWGPTELTLDNGSRVMSVAFSQDGSRVVSGSFDNTVRIWNATTGEVEAELKGHTDTVTSVAFSQDGSRAVSGSYDKTVRIWNATTGEVEAELKGHTDTVTSVAFSQDGSRVVSGSFDSTVCIWNATTGDVEAELKGHTHMVTSVAFSQDGSRAVSGSYDSTVRIWNATTGEVEAELKGHMDVVASVAFSQDGSRVVSGSYDKTVRIWNATTGEVEAELKGHTDTVTSVAFSQDRSRVVSGSHDNTVRIWNATTGEVEAELKGHTDTVTSVAFSQDGSRVVSGSYDKTICIWNATTGDVEAELKGHTDMVTSVAFSQDGSRAVSGSYDKTVRIWNATTGEVEAELKGHRYPVMSVAFSQDCSRVVSGSNDETTVRIWNTTTGESQLMATPIIILPDSTEVHSERIGMFSILYPVQQPTLSMHHPLSISMDRKWILGPLRDCWILPHFRDFRCSSFSGSRVCFGLPSSSLVILDMAIDT
ncbi:mycorrhiza-induced WD40-repeat domain protein [Mycena sp. CBHHK59/15]|nr:mycorrhiza-induced WD40-repeat domain protein [Mycena sp. CBHHK59/15]